MQVIILWAIQQAYFDAIPVHQVSDKSKELESFFHMHQPAVLEALYQQKAITPKLEESLKDALNDWKRRSL